MLDNAGNRADSVPPDGSPPGSDYETTSLQLLDAFPYHRAVLMHDIGEYPMHINPYLGAAICSAVNDWNVDHWLGRDERLRSVVVVPPMLPDEAAAEIRRVGPHPDICGVLIAGNPLGTSAR